MLNTLEELATLVYLQYRWLPTLFATRKKKPQTDATKANGTVTTLTPNPVSNTWKTQFITATCYPLIGIECPVPLKTA